MRRADERRLCFGSGVLVTSWCAIILARYFYIRVVVVHFLHKCVVPTSAGKMGKMRYASHRSDSISD
jgi:hypothetical protein